jgi:transglutaminase-like putative cysteine protease
MTPGNISALIQSSAVAFRAEFDNQPPPQPQLYWRALVLWYFDGRSWERGKTNPTPQASIEPLSDVINYQITLEPHQQDWLFALDMPLEVPEPISYSNNFELSVRDKISSLYQYQLGSVPEYIIQSQLSPWERSAGLKIPTEGNPQTRALGRQLAQQYSDPQQIVSQVLAMFNAEDYHYTLNPPLTPGDDAVDQFLFQTRRGFCEHYAGSFALLMRAAGVPARVVLGYQGGTLNPLNQVITVRQSDAHAWVEVWLEQQGWLRVDPTAAIAPQRIERNLNAALDASEIRPLHMQLNNGLLQQLVFYWDAMDNQWKQWVIGYDDKLQQALLNRLFNQKLPFAEMILYMLVSFMLMLLAISLFIMRPWKRPRVEPVQRSYQQFCNKLARLGVQRQDHEGPLDFAQRAAQQLPQQAASIELISRLYMRLRYQSGSSEKLLAQFQRMVRKFKPFAGRGEGRQAEKPLTDSEPDEH